MATLHPALVNEIVELILRQNMTTPDARSAWLTTTIADPDVIGAIDVNGASRTFAAQVVNALTWDQLIMALQGLKLGDTDTLTNLCRRIEQHKLSATLNGHPNPLLADYRHKCIARWQDERYHVDQDFVRLIVLRRDDKRGLIEPEGAREYQDLRVLLAETTERAVVLLGAPGSGKSTLLRRLQTDHARDRLADNGHDLSFFVPLNEYDDSATDARAWLAARWHDEYPGVGDFDLLFDAGRFLFLLDALNEMPQRDRADYQQRVTQWKRFVALQGQRGNRAVFTCRSLDYSLLLGSDDAPVPQVTVKPMTPSLIREFLVRYLPDAEQAARVYARLNEDERQLELYSTPYFLSLLVKQVAADGAIPMGRAELFTRFVRAALARELGRQFAPLLMDDLLSEEDRIAINTGRLSGYDLPEEGALIPRLTALASTMQTRERNASGSQVSLPRAEALDLIAHPLAKEVLKAGEGLNILDKADGSAHPIKFFHQLLQEFFAARPLVQALDATLVQQPWRTRDATPPLPELLSKLADSDPLPPLPTTGWEETARIAAAMTNDPDGFVRAVMPSNLSLAGVIAAAADVSTSDALKDDLRWALVRRSQDGAADLRARIAAGEALGRLGDPRFVRRTGPHGDYLLPPLAQIAGGSYTLGDTRYLARFRGGWDDERPACAVTLKPFEIGQFPITNAEFKCFIDASGYDQAQWWDTPAAQKWLGGERSEGPKQSWRETRKFWQTLSDAAFRKRFAGRWTTLQIENNLRIKTMSDADFEAVLDDWYPTREQESEERWNKPAYWFDPTYNNPAQPVVGVCWHEARAYCNWMSAQSGQAFRLPTEAEWEATARGKTLRTFSYAGTFDAQKGNTFESHIRRTTPVGIFAAGATPEQVFDLTGNVWEWTSSNYLPYPYETTAEREDPAAEV